MAKPKDDDVQPIQRGSVYLLRDFLKITGMGQKGLREARDNGLRVVIHGRVGYVSGDDFNDWILDESRKTERWPGLNGKSKD